MHRFKNPKTVLGLGMWLLAVAMLIGGQPFRLTASAAPRADGQLELQVVDADSGLPLTTRMHLKNTRGRPVRLRLPASSQFGDHCYVDGRIVLPLRAGQYTFELDAGPEFRSQNGHFEIQRHADDAKTIEMHRVVDLQQEGWWAGDLDVARPQDVLPLAMRGEGVSLAPTQVAAESAAPVLKVESHALLRTPFAWDLPVWLAKDELSAIMLIDRQTLRGDVIDDETDGPPRDRVLFSGKTGRGRWAEVVYYHVLECGLRIPPAAGSGTGANDSPLGANRVYAHCGDKFTAERWWDALEAGRVFVTNGPLLRPMVEGKLPGYVYHFREGKRLSLEIALNLATREPVEYLEIIKNGNISAEVRLDQWAKLGGRLPPLEFVDSGWFLIRAVTTNRNKYQLALSGPYYVERAGRSRISRQSVQFFLDWIDAASEHYGSLQQLDAPTRAAKLAEQVLARRFFEALAERANAD